MTLKESILKDLKEAMKKGDNIKRDTLRMLDAMIKNTEIDKKKRETGLSEEEIQVLITQAVKQRKDAIAQYKKGGREELAEKEQKELNILNVYRPKQLSEDEVKLIVKKTILEVGATSLTEMGQVMGASMKHLKGKADGEMVKKIVQAELN